MELQYGDGVKVNSHEERLEVIELLKDWVHPSVYDKRNDSDRFNRFPYLIYDRVDECITGYVKHPKDTNLMDKVEFLTKALGTEYKPKTYEGEVFKHKFF